jgi:DNA-binding MarR family transcriptional regulator
VSNQPRALAELLDDCQRESAAYFARRLRAAGYGDIRAAHDKVFTNIGDGATVSELAQRAQLTKQAMTELVEHLERMGYVERVPHADDRRARLVRLTARGERCVSAATSVLLDVERRWARLVGRQRYGDARAVLAAILGAMRDEQSASSARPPVAQRRRTRPRV